MSDSGLDCSVVGDQKVAGLVPSRSSERIFLSSMRLHVPLVYTFGVYIYHVLTCMPGGVTIGDSGPCCCVLCLLSGYFPLLGDASPALTFIQCPFYFLRVTTVTHQRACSFCQNSGWQVTDIYKHARPSEVRVG